MNSIDCNLHVATWSVAKLRHQKVPIPTKPAHLSSQLAHRASSNANSATSQQQCSYDFFHILATRYHVIRTLMHDSEKVFVIFSFAEE
jgi:hypothetical protein